MYGVVTFSTHHLMEGSTLANLNNIKDKDQGHLTVFVLMNLLSIMLKLYTETFHGCSMIS